MTISLNDFTHDLAKEISSLSKKEGILSGKKVVKLANNDFEIDISSPGNALGDALDSLRNMEFRYSKDESETFVNSISLLSKEEAQDLIKSYEIIEKFTKNKKIKEVIVNQKNHLQKIIGNSPLEENLWMKEFLTEKSKIPIGDHILQKIAKAIIDYPTLNQLVKDTSARGNYLKGWTENSSDNKGSKGFTEINTGDIWIGKRDGSSEAMTLGYECINSKNKALYKEISLKYMNVEPNKVNREKFAEEILGIEAQALFFKCKLATEMGKRDLIKDHYLEVFDNEKLGEEEKILRLKDVMKEKGIVHKGSSSEQKAFTFYQNERFDELINWYKHQKQK